MGSCRKESFVAQIRRKVSRNTRTFYKVSILFLISKNQIKEGEVIEEYLPSGYPFIGVVSSVPLVTRKSTKIKDPKFRRSTMGSVGLRLCLERSDGIHSRTGSLWYFLLYTNNVKIQNTNKQYVVIY